ncbi:MAG: ABC transporter permease [Eubacteriales bacterium]|nr:ABC transporter permease [Eubacteriales bacterium]
MKMQNFFKRFGIILVLIALFVFFSITTKGTFIKPGNLLNVARQVSMIGICAVGMAIVMITGGMDLSVGSLQGLLGVLGALMMTRAGFSIWATVLSILLLGILFGLFHAFVFNTVGIPPMIITLAMYTAYRGLAYVISGGVPVFGLPEDFSTIGQGYLWFIPIPVIIMALVMIFGWFLLTKTSTGKYIYGIGGNEEACRLSGVNIKNMRYFIFGLSSFLASLASIVLLSRVNSGQPRSGTGFEFEVITAVVLGGVSIKGGVGNISGVLVGVLIMGVMKNGFVLMNVNEYFQMVLQGFVLLAAVGFDMVINRPNKLSKARVIEESSTRKAETA